MSSVFMDRSAKLTMARADVFEVKNREKLLESRWPEATPSLRQAIAVEMAGRNAPGPSRSMQLLLRFSNEDNANREAGEPLFRRVEKAASHILEETGLEREVVPPDALARKAELLVEVSDKLWKAMIAPHELLAAWNGLRGDLDPEMLRYIRRMNGK